MPSHSGASFWKDVVDSDDETSGTSVYEEQGFSGDEEEENMMMEIVRERLLNGWASSSDNEFLYDTDDEFDIARKPKNNNVLETAVTPDVPKAPVPGHEYTTPAPGDKKPDKLRHLASSSDEDSDSNYCTPVANPQKTPTSASIVKQENNPWQSFITQMQKKESNAATIISGLLSRGVHISSVIAMLNNPAAMHAFNDLRRRESEKSEKKKVNNDPPEILINDLVDCDLLAEDVECDDDEDCFQKWSSIPLNTFYRSQKVGRRHRLKELNRAVKKQSESPSLNRTLFKRRKRSPSNLLSNSNSIEKSPFLTPTREKELEKVKMDDLELAYPLPFEL